MVKSGHFFDDNHPDKNRGWVVGNYVEDPMFKSSDVQLKYQKRKAGDIAPAKQVLDVETNSLAILIYGDVVATFEGHESPVKMSKTGDYIKWSPDVPHEFKYIQDTLIITLRWKN